jgi:hypothetical protein
MAVVAFGEQLTQVGTLFMYPLSQQRASTTAITLRISRIYITMHRFTREMLESNIRCVNVRKSWGDTWEPWLFLKTLVYSLLKSMSLNYLMLYNLYSWIRSFKEFTNKSIIVKNIRHTVAYINPLKPSGKNIYHLFYRSVIVHSVFMGILWLLM